MTELFHYLENCLKGKAYPEGDLQVEDIPWVKAVALSYIFDPEQNINQKEQWERLKFYTKLNSSKFFKVLTNAFDDPLFSSVNLNVFLSDSTKPEWVELKTVLIDHQVISSCLFGCMIDQSNAQKQSFVEVTENKSWKFTVKEQENLLSFIGKYTAKGTIKINDYELNRVLGYLALSVNKETKKKRENLLYNLIRNLPPSRYDSDKILLLCEGSEMYRVCELFYLRKKDYFKAIYSYLIDSERSPQVFNFIRSLVGNAYLPDHDKVIIKSATIDQLPDLVKVRIFFCFLPFPSFSLFPPHSALFIPFPSSFCLIHPSSLLLPLPSSFCLIHPSSSSFHSLFPFLSNSYFFKYLLSLSSFSLVLLVVQFLSSASPQEPLLLSFIFPPPFATRERRRKETFCFRFIPLLSFPPSIFLCFHSSLFLPLSPTFSLFLPLASSQAGSFLYSISLCPLFEK